jgi:hypothetical protein
MISPKLSLAGTEVPRIGLGTSRLMNTPVHVDLVKTAVAAGVGYIDTAQLGARHPISGRIPSRPAGARSAARPQTSDERSADPPATTNTKPAQLARQEPLDEYVR